MNYLKLMATVVLLVGCMGVGQIASAQVELKPGTTLHALDGIRHDDYPGGTIPWAQYQDRFFSAGSSFYAAGEFPGGVTSAVLRDNPNNPDHLTFFYQFSNHSADYITRFTVSGFAGLDVRVGWTGVGWAGTAPASISRTFAVDDGGNWINEDFSDSGVPSFFGQRGNLYIYTELDVHAPVFQNLAYFTGTSGHSDSLRILAPYPVPEPETYAMLLAGLGVLGSMARRRKQNAA
jgi:hypothetical protein